MEDQQAEAFMPTELEQAIEEYVLDTPAPGTHCARSAFRHLRKAWILIDVDPEMAAFRAITAEEESAAALFHALRRWDYQGADSLRPRSHFQKAALIPFYEAVSEVLEVNHQAGIMTRLVIDKRERRLGTSVDFSRVAPGVPEMAPIPPLHFTIKSDDRLHDFQEQLEEAVRRRGVSSVEKYIAERANKRNQLLYATSTGVPSVTALNNFLPAQRQHVVINLVLYLLIDPYPKHQLFVEQGLRAFLKMLGKLPDGIDFG